MFLGQNSPLRIFLQRFAEQTELVVEESAGELSVRCHAMRSKWTLAPAFVFFAFWTWLAFRTGWGWPGLAFGVFAMVKYLWDWKDDVLVVMNVSPKGFETQGNFGGGYQPVRWVQWREITRICYAKGSGGEDDYAPAGLWASGPGVKTCLLPGLSEDSAQELAERIYTKFPDVKMAQDTEWKGLFQETMITLGLGRD